MDCSGGDFHCGGRSLEFTGNFLERQFPDGAPYEIIVVAFPRFIFILRSGFFPTVVSRSTGVRCCAVSRRVVRRVEFQSRGAALALSDRALQMRGNLLDGENVVMRF